VAGINWRSQIDIDEENRYGSRRDPNRVTAVLTLQCAGGCGTEIVEIHYQDGRRSYDHHGVRTVLGKGTYCRRCGSDK
jgi:hypothetical protein